jgi:hypothetical protein
MTTTTTVTNGRARKSLAEQIDRLDSILDGLAEALQGAVAEAVTEAVGLAVKEAVKCVLAEVLTSPEFLERLRQVAASSNPTPAMTAPRQLGVFRRWIGRASTWACDRLGDLRQAVTAAASFIGRSISRAGRYVQTLLPFRRQLLLSAAVGTLAGVAAYHATPILAAAVAWVGGFATALTVQAAVLLRQWLLLAGIRERSVCGRGGV